MSATDNGHERVVELLMRHGAEINLQRSDGSTALMDAAVDHERLVELCCCGAARRSTRRTASASPH